MLMWMGSRAWSVGLARGRARGPWMDGAIYLLDYLLCISCRVDHSLMDAVETC